MIRGFVAVEVMTPKEGPELTLLFGLLKFAVFVRLKNSARTWMLWDSAKGNPRSNVSLGRAADQTFATVAKVGVCRICSIWRFGSGGEGVGI
jgi:hypothetical protein